VAAASAKEQEPILVAELKATDGNVFGRAEAGRLSKVTNRRRPPRMRRQ
jgi:hypothetical protein